MIDEKTTHIEIIKLPTKMNNPFEHFQYVTMRIVNDYRHLVFALISTDVHFVRTSGKQLTDYDVEHETEYPA